MKQFYFPLLALLMSFISTDVYAHDIAVQNGGKTIYYNFINNNTELEVTFLGADNEYFSNSDRYSGELVIPEAVIYDNNTYPVTSIGEHAFFNCKTLTSISIPNSVTSIGDNAFESCSGITSITIPNSVTSFGRGAFVRCTGLTSFTIPNSVTSIGLGAFQYCTGLTSITIPSNVTSIGVAVFGFCEGLVSLNVESGNTKYDSRNNCNAIIETETNKLIRGTEKTIIPDAVTSIEAHAFSGYRGLTSIAIPNNVTSIGDEAFSHCRALASITIPNSVTSIGQSAFYNCSELSSISIPNSVTSIGNSAFQYCSNILSVIVKYNTPLAITESVFSNSTNATLYVPAGSKADYEAADNWKNFKEIIEAKTVHVETAGTLSSLITNEEKYTITSLVVTGQINGEDLRLLREMAGNDYNGFTTEGNLSYLDLCGATIVAGGNYIELTEGKVYFDKEKKSYSGEYSTEALPSQANVLGDLAFAGCNTLETIKLPAALVSIGAQAFMNTSLSTIVWSNSLTTIGNAAFSGSRFTSFTLPVSVETMGDNIVANCTSLTELNVASNNLRFDSRGNCNAIINRSWNRLVCGTKTTVIPSTVTSIGNCAFHGLGLTSVTIPSGITQIGNNAYGWNNMTSVTIPASVTSMGDAFNGCNDLTTVTVEWSSPIAIGETTFTNRANAKLLVPVGSMNKYKEADYWKDFGEIIEAKTIHVETAGTLSSLISAEEKLSITGLILTGNLNGTDFRVLREMAGNDYNGFTTDGNLRYLDLSGATIVAGGNYIELTEGKVYFDKEKKSYSGEYSTEALPSQANVLGDFAFAGCNKLETIKLPANLESIGLLAFMNTSLKTIVWPNSLTIIGNGAFDGCRFTSFTLPASVQTLGYNIVANCTSLTELNVASGNTVFDSRDNCNAIIKKSTNELVCGIKTTVIPSTVTSIGDAAFHGLGLTSITIPSNITQIGDNAYGWNNMTSVTIPASVTSMGYAFNGCNNLETVIVKETSPITIAEKTFTNRTNATLYVPSGSKTAYEAADYWKEFKEIIEAKTVHVETAGTLSSLISNDEKLSITNLTITGNLNGTDFRLIREMAGNDYQGEPTNGSLKILDLSGANIVAGGEMYLDTENLTSSTGSTGGAHHCETADNVLGDHLFGGCDKLEEVIFPNSITAIHGPVFWYCLNLKSIEIPENVSSMGLLVNGSHNISSITVAEGNHTYNSPAGSNAIMQGTKLLLGCKNTQIPAGTTVIGEFAFIYCEGLGEFTVPEGVTTIETSAFECSDLTSIHLPSTLTTIGINAFSWCNNLTSFTLPKTVTSIGNIDSSIFRGSRLTELNVEAGNTVYESPDDCNAIIEKASHKLVCSSLNTVIPETVTSIGSDAFYGSQLQSITIPNSVTSIGERAFMYGKLTSITIPSSVVTIGNKVFYDCYNLTSVTVEATTPIAIGEDVFTDRENKTLYVPVGSKAVYKAANYWKDFGEIIEVGTESLYADNVIAYKGTQAVLPILLNNEQTIAGIQFDLQLPSGFSVAKSGEDYLANLTNRASGLSVSVSKLTSGDYRFVVVSSEGNKVTGTEGEVMNVTINVPADATIGDNTITMNNVVLTAVVSGENTSLYPANPTSVLTVLDYTLGDVNDDSNINVVDVAAIAAHVAGQTPTGFIKIAADVNTDGVVNSADVTAEVTNALQAASVGTGTSAGQLLNASDFVAFKGKNVTLPISLTNSQAISGFQFDLQLPEGVSIAHNGIKLASRANGLTVNTSALTATTTRFVVVATSGSTMAAGEGEVMSITLAVAANAASGTVTLNNTVLAVKNDNILSDVYTTDVEAAMTVRSFTLGDVNDDNHINVTDVVCVVDDILGRTPSNFIRFAADINGDDEVNVTDVMGLVDIILSAQGLAATRGDVDENVSILNGLDLNGNDGQLSLSVKDAGNYVASQLEVILSEGQTLEGITLNDAFKQTHQLIFARSGQSTYTVLVFSMGNENYPQNDDELLKLNVSGSAGEIVVDEAIMVTRQQEQKRMAPVSSFKVETGNELMDIYSLDGRLIKSQVKDTKGLSKGVYIINGKKVMVQ